MNVIAKNKNYFFKKGGDDYFKRSIYGLGSMDYDNDPVIKLIKELKDKVNNLIEIGCGDGARLNFIHNKLRIDSYGIDPSHLAIKNTKHLKSHCKIGSADKIPFLNKKFDIVLFGQSVMYFDDDLLPKIVSETFNILSNKSYIIINDFYSKKIKYKTYKHYKKIKIRKMDNSKLFLWHPQIKLIKQKIYSYKNSKKRDNQVSLDLLRYYKKN